MASASTRVITHERSRQSQEDSAAWNRIAEGYDRTNTVTQMWLGEEGLRRAGLGSGMKFLDVASGSGALSIPAARLGADVVAVDQSPVMLELLTRRARQEGLGIETRVMDGHSLEFDDDSFDRAGSQFGVMLFPDMPKGISEMARVTRHGGRVLMTAYGDPHELEFLGFFVRAIQTVRPTFSGPPMNPPPLPFQLQDPERLCTELAACGLKDIKVETIIETTAFQSGKALWEWIVCSNPIVETVLSSLALASDEQNEIQRALEELFRERADGSGTAKLTNPINIGIGTK
jgi:ubiquinone/menaquinone biosynthesis C-methylase UbiE